MNLQELAEKGEELKKEKYDSPIVKMWENDLKTAVAEYGKEISEILDSALSYDEMITSDQHGQQMHVEAIDKVQQLLRELQSRSVQDTATQSESVDEFWKCDGVMWQILQSGDLFDVDSMSVYCLNCFYELRDDLKCDDCGKSHKMNYSISESANRSSKSLNASMKRDSYSVRSPQVGEKLAEVDLDLSNDKFMNVKLEKRKNGEQVVITTGKKGEKEKAQIFIDLSKNEIRHDQTDQDPSEVVDKVKFVSDSQEVSKSFNKQAAKSATETEGPDIFLQHRSINRNTGEISFMFNSYEDKPWHLEEISFGEAKVGLDRNIEPNRITESVSTRGLPMPPYETKISTIEFTISRQGQRWQISQDVRMDSRADGHFTLHKITEKQSGYKKVD